MPVPLRAMPVPLRAKPVIVMELNNRKSIRLSGYNYSNNGYYFVTICTQDRQCLFGNIQNTNMILNDLGEIVESVLKTLPIHHPVELDICQTMPNHIHLIIVIVGVLRAMPVLLHIPENTGCARTTPTGFGHVVAGTLSCIIRSFKSETTKQIRRIMQKSNITIWQRNYYPLASA